MFKHNAKRGLLNGLEIGLIQMCSYVNTMKILKA